MLGRSSDQSDSGEDESDIWEPTPTLEELKQAYGPQGDQKVNFLTRVLERTVGWNRAHQAHVVSTVVG